MYFCFIMVEGTNLQHSLFYIIFDILHYQTKCESYCSPIWLA